jgi:hypothetical protein
MEVLDMVEIMAAEPMEIQVDRAVNLLGGKWTPMPPDTIF